MLIYWQISISCVPSFLHFFESLDMKLSSFEANSANYVLHRKLLRRQRVCKKDLCLHIIRIHNGLWPSSKNGYPQLHPGEICGAVVSFISWALHNNNNRYQHVFERESKAAGKLMRCSIQNQYSAGWS